MLIISIGSFCQSTYKPVKATITDSQGSFSSSTFDCPNMIVYDKGNSVQLSWGGETIPLYKDKKVQTLFLLLNQNLV